MYVSAFDKSKNTGSSWTRPAKKFDSSFLHCSSPWLWGVNSADNRQGHRFVSLKPQKSYLRISLQYLSRRFSAFWANAHIVTKTWTDETYFDEQGCQIFMVQHTKTGKIYQMTTKCTQRLLKIPNGRRTYPMANKYTKKFHFKTL
jgi:hypothetical protein